MTDRSQEQSIHDPEKLRVMFIGEGLVLSAAIALVKKRGHDIVGVFCASALEYETMKRNHLPVSPPGSSVKAFFSQRPFDVLFSINNGRILKASTIDLAQLAAVNYHNGPLPAYAGRWVTAWAILNGEATHGVTWHLIESGIDTGPILVQRRFELAQVETTGSLNLRCTQAAIEGFSEVLDKLERRDIRPVVQDPARRSYFRKADTAPNGGLVDWTRSADDIVRLVRACDWGSSENRFGEARVDLAETGVRLVRSAEKASGSGPAGTVLAAAGSEVTVACADGAVRFRLADAKAMDADLPLPSAVGATQPDDRPASAANSVIDLILAQASARPDAMAIGGACREVSRKDLVDRSLAVGARLLAEGVQLDDGVGILLPIGSDFVASALGAMMSGGAYVPLSAKSPDARLAREVAEAGVTHVVTTRSLADRLPASVGVKILFLDELPNEQADLSPRMPGPDQCAYRIFTSGSTGGIKSVEIGHSSLLNLCLHYKTAIPMGEDARMTALSSVTFDASVADIWPVLACGGALLIPPENLLMDVRHLIK